MINLLLKLCLILVLIPFLVLSYTDYSDQLMEAFQGIPPDHPGLGIVNGVGIDIEYFPWLVQITKKDKFHCGGVVVSKRVIVTAAHCIFNNGTIEKAEYFKVLVGSSYKLEGTEYKVCYIKQHIKYFNPIYVQYPYFYDIALLLLTSDIQFNDRVQPATFVTDSHWRSPESTIIVAGFGKTSTDGNSSLNLQMSYMRYLNQKKCSSWPTEFGLMPVPDHMFCMMGLTPSGDCYGDSGSGIMWGGYVIGIVSSGMARECGTLTVPSLYTSVAAFKNWIQRSLIEFDAIAKDYCPYLKWS